MDSHPGRVSRARRAAIREFLETRNATIEQIARRFFTGNTPETARKKASRWLCKERRRKRARIRGVVTLNGTGRPQLGFPRLRVVADGAPGIAIGQMILRLGVALPRNSVVEPGKDYFAPCLANSSGVAKYGHLSRISEVEEPTFSAVQTAWRCAQSSANLSPLNSLLTGKNTGNLRDFDPKNRTAAL